MLFVLVTTFFCLPETKGRSAAELDEMFEARVPARQFKRERYSIFFLPVLLIKSTDYQCRTARENFLEEVSMEKNGAVVVQAESIRGAV